MINVRNTNTWLLAADLNIYEKFREWVTARSMFLQKLLNTYDAMYWKIFSDVYIQCRMHGVFSVFKKIMCI